MRSLYIRFFDFNDDHAVNDINNFDAFLNLLLPLVCLCFRIMRRQRPGSVERKVHEETVMKFFSLLQDYGKDSVDKDQREKQLLDMQRKQQAELIGLKVASYDPNWTMTFSMC